MSDTKYVIFSSDFKPMDGGVADYAYNLAKQLHQNKLLYKVITYTPQQSKFGFDVVRSYMIHQRNLGERLGDSIFFFRKLNTFIHQCILYLAAFRDLVPLFSSRHNKRIVIVSYYGYYTQVFVDACRILGLQFEIVYHGLDIIINSKQDKKKFRLLSGKAKGLIFNSAATQNLYRRYVPNVSNREQILYPGIDVMELNRYSLLGPEYFNNRWGLELEKKTVITCVTRLVKRKGVDLAIRAIGNLLKKRNDILFLIAGKGEEYENIKNLIEELQLTRDIRLLGFISDREKFSLLASSKIFLLPSITLGGNDFEGFGISLIEAGFYNNVCIAGSHGGMSEALRDGVTGFNLQSDGENAHLAIENTILDILDSPGKLTSMGNAAGIYVRERFDWANLAMEFVNLRKPH